MMDHVVLSALKEKKKKYLPEENQGANIRDHRLSWGTWICLYVYIWMCLIKEFSLLPSQPQS